MSTRKSCVRLKPFTTRRTRGRGQRRAIVKAQAKGTGPRRVTAKALATVKGTGSRRVRAKAQEKGIGKTGSGTQRGSRPITTRLGTDKKTIVMAG